MTDPDEQQAWLMVEKIADLIADRDSLIAERDALRKALEEMGMDMSAWDAAALGEDTP